MNIDELHSEWDKDSDFNIDQVGKAALEISKLHNKYYRLYIKDVMKYKQLEQKLKILRLEKYEFLTLGHTNETKQRGWELPPQGKILKNEVEMYIDTDKEVIDAFLMLTRTEGIIPALESSHAIAEAIKLAKKRPKTDAIVVTLSGRGDKDVEVVQENVKNSK